jgi:hypothetical protein
MLRSIASAIIASAALLAATGAPAQTVRGYYVATPAAAPAKTQLMTRATPWRLQGASFVAAQAPERDLVLCQLVAKDVGELSSFSAGGKAFDADQLGKCNAKASVAKVTIAKAGAADATAANN